MGPYGKSLFNMKKVFQVSYL